LGLGGELAGSCPGCAASWHDGTVTIGPAAPVDGAVAYGYPPPQPKPTKRRWLVIAAAGWVVLLLVIATYAALHGRPTVREQTTIGQALPVLDRVVAEVVTVGTAAGAVPVIEGYVRTEADCFVTAARSGERYERSAVLYAPEGREDAVLDAVVAGLPAGYRINVRRGDSLHSITGDAGFFVRLAGGVTGTGRLQFTADSQCRAHGGSVPDPPAASIGPAGPAGPAGQLRASADAVFTALQLAVVEMQTQQVACPHGGTLWTVELRGAPGRAPASLVAALRSGALPGVVVLARPEVYAVRSNPVAVVATVRDGLLVVDASTGC
jgi:hypothetical protein